MTNELPNPLKETIFRWSCFYDDKDFSPYGSEYPSAEAAEDRHRFEDDQIAFDTGQPVRKMLLGVYDGGNTDVNTVVFTADTWDKTRKDLVGCATLLDWEMWRETGEEFTEENALELLREEVAELTEWYNARKQQERRAAVSVEELLKELPAITNSVELLDLYHIWRSLFSLRSETASGAEVYDSVKMLQIILDRLLSGLEEKLTDESNDSPEEFIIDHIKSQRLSNGRELLPIMNNKPQIRKKQPYSHYQRTIRTAFNYGLVEEDDEGMSEKEWDDLSADQQDRIMTDFDNDILRAKSEED